MNWLDSRLKMCSNVNEDIIQREDQLQQSQRQCRTKERTSESRCRRSLRSKERCVTSALQMLLRAYQLKSGVPVSKCTDGVQTANPAKETEPEWRIPDERDTRLQLKQLQQLIDQGIIDSILPQITNILLSRTHATGASEKSDTPITSAVVREKVSPTQKGRFGNAADDVSISIQVVEQQLNKDITRTFACSKQALLEHMPYFRRVAADTTLESVDISVHCDVVVFNWLMTWVQNNGSVPIVSRNDDEGYCEKPPQFPFTQPPLPLLTAVLSAAEFLGMNTLVEHCLQISAENMKPLLSVTTTESTGNSPSKQCCLSDTMLKRLAERIGHQHLESTPTNACGSTSDAFNCSGGRLRVQLYRKLTQQLCRPSTQPHLGRFESASGLYRCANCHKLLTPAVQLLVPCPAGVDGYHRKQKGWQLCHAVSRLRTTLRSWRLVYWRLWAVTHWLYCSKCHRWFPAADWAHCRYHPQLARCDDSVIGIASPPGVFSCCGRPVVSFNVTCSTNTVNSGENDGCCSCPHEIDKVKSSSAIAEELNIYRHLIDASCKALDGNEMSDDNSFSDVCCDSLIPEILRRVVTTDTEASAPVLCSSGESADNCVVKPRQMSRQTSVSQEVSGGIQHQDTLESGAEDEEEDGAGNMPQVPLTTRVYSGRQKTSRGYRRLVPPVALPTPAIPEWNCQNSLRQNQDAQRRRERLEMQKIADVISTRWQHQCGIIEKPMRGGTFASFDSTVSICRRRKTTRNKLTRKQRSCKR